MDANWVLTTMCTFFSIWCIGMAVDCLRDARYGMVAALTYSGLVFCVMASVSLSRIVG